MIADSIAQRFRLPAVPTLLSSTPHSSPLSIARVRCATTDHGASRVVPVEDAYVVNISLDRLDAKFWLDGRRVNHDGAGGGTYLFNLQSNPVADFVSAFDIVRFYISRATLDELSLEAGLASGAGLTPPPLGTRDGVMLELARAMLPALQMPDQVNQLYIDYMALAFHAHLVSSYGGPCRAFRQSRQGLSSTHARIATEMISSRLDARLSVAELAIACNLSVSHFSRAFIQTFGMPPHRLLLTRRVERAVTLIESGRLALPEVARECGFTSHSHFARVFAAVSGMPPSKWRRRAVWLSLKSESEQNARARPVL